MARGQTSSTGVLLLGIAALLLIIGGCQRSANTKRLERRALFATTGQRADCEHIGSVFEHTRVRRGGPLERTYTVTCRYFAEGREYERTFTLHKNPLAAEEALDFKRQYYRDISPTLSGDSWRRHAQHAEAQAQAELDQVWTVTYLPADPAYAVLGDLADAFPNDTTESDVLFLFAATSGLIGMVLVVSARARARAGLESEGELTAQ